MVGERMTASPDHRAGTAGVGRLAPAAVALIALVGLWEAAVRLLQIEAFLLPAPSAVFTEFVADASVIWSAGFKTLIEAVGGLVAGTIGGILVAFVVARWEAVRLGAMPFAAAVNAMPIVAVAPITIALFGLTNPVSRMAVVALMVFFPVMINTTRGLLSADANELELMRSYGASGWSILRRVRIPSAHPYFFSALKIVVPLSLIGAIVSEYFGGPQDVLGQYITNRAQLFQFPDAWAAMLVAAILGIGMYSLVLLAERLVMPWHVSVRTSDQR